jgi:hypothetical protein
MTGAFAAVISGKGVERDETLVHQLSSMLTIHSTMTRRE